MRFSYTKSFRFSASYSDGLKIIGHNYRLDITTDPPGQESDFEKRVQSALIAKIHTRDLSLHVDFLKNTPITDERLLEAFRGVLEKELAPLKIQALNLERDDRTRVTLWC